MSKTIKITAIILSAVLLPFLIIAAQIYFYDEAKENQTADAAIVLGAAVWTDKPSPVFRERINHAVNLYKQKRIKKIIFTGGQGNDNEKTEARIGQIYAVEKGIPTEDILIENKSSTTFENLEFAKEVMRKNNIKSVLIVTDPLHMKRSMAMAEFLEINALPEPTPTSVYQGFWAKTDFLLRETFYCFLFQLRDLVRPM